MNFTSSVLGKEVILHFLAIMPTMPERTSTRGYMEISRKYSFRPMVRNSASVNSPMVPSSSPTGAWRSTQLNISGATYSCVRLYSTSSAAMATQINRTRFLTFHAIFTIHPTFWAALYFGFILSFILPHLVSILYHKKTSPEDSGDELLILGDELHFGGFLILNSN